MDPWPDFSRILGSFYSKGIVLDDDKEYGLLALLGFVYEKDALNRMVPLYFDCLVMKDYKSAEAVLLQSVEDPAQAYGTLECLASYACRGDTDSDVYLYVF